MVVIALKTPLHKPTAMQVLEARKPIYLEWPLGNGLQEAIELAEAARTRGVRTMIGLQARQDPAIRKARDLLGEGTIGKVLSTNFIGYAGSWGASVPQRDAYTLDASTGATITSIPFGHFVDSLVYLLGDLASLSAYKATLRGSTVIEGTGRTVTASAEDQLVVQGQLESGALVAVHYKGGQAPKGSEGLVWEIEGEEGVITFKAAGVGHVQVRSPFTATQPSNACLSQLISPKLYLNGEQVQLPEDKLGNIGRLYEAFAMDDKGGYNDWDHAVRVHRIVDAVERSCREGRRTSYHESWG
jgi:predicted dehydrogenase